MSHDLRAPLRSIDGFSPALLEDCAEALDDDGKRYLRHVREAAQEMGQLIDDLLKLARVARAELSWTDVDLSALAQLTIRALRKNRIGNEIVVAHDGIGPSTISSPGAPMRPARRPSLPSSCCSI